MAEAGCNDSPHTHTSVPGLQGYWRAVILPVCSADFIHTCYQVPMIPRSTGQGPCLLGESRATQVGVMLQPCARGRTLSIWPGQMESEEAFQRT